MSETRDYDLIVIGSGPAGHVASQRAARAGKKVLIIERDRGVGGACVQRGTIPSKTLRETAVYFAGLKLRSGDAVRIDLPPSLQLRGLMSRMESVISAHSELIIRDLTRAGVDQMHGRARFVTPHEVEIVAIRGKPLRMQADVILIATGSRPRTPPHIPVDHEHILDSDSLLSTMYLPESLAVLGGGVIASEYASIFAELGVRVTMVDRYALPLGFMDQELARAFVEHFESHDGCRFLAERTVLSAEWDGASSVVTHLDDGTVIRSDKMFCALGRVANLEDLCLEKAGLSPTDRGILAVDEHGRTEVPGVYAAGDVIGPPSLASSSKEQGRRAVCHAFGMPEPASADTIPVGIYTIPEMSSVGLTEERASERWGEVVVGRAGFDEVARGLIGGNASGFLKLVARASDGVVVGAQAVGEGSTELIHLAQMALLNEDAVDVFVENIFNFPTLAELYQLAAMDAVMQREARLDEGPGCADPAPIAPEPARP